MVALLSRMWWMFAALGLALAPARAEAASPEARVKAAYLYKLASFVRWPDDAARRSEFRLCVAGGGELTQVLQDLVRGERVLGLPVAVDALGAQQAARGRSCQVLFLARGAETARTMIQAVDGAPVLTVGDRSGGTRGGVIDFLIRDGKVRFVIDRTLAKRQRLDLSSKLLDIALAVEP